MLSRARERYPDRTFADLGAEPQEGVADLDEAISEMLEEYATNQKTYDEKNGRLSELLMSDPSAAEFIQKWVDTGDPRTALIEAFGDELGMNEESQANFKESLASYRERKSANDALEAAAQENLQASYAALDQWGDAKGLSLEDKRDVFLLLFGIVANGMENKYTPEDFEMAYNALHYANDVANARHEGEVAGRNSKIEAARHDRTAAGNMPPVAGGRQGGVVKEKTPEPKKVNPFAGIR